jgi:signal transduction histidine kinase
MVLADRNYLSLILRNLVNNAIKFTPENGKVLIEAKHCDNQIKLCVEDDGIGMSKEDIEKLFNFDKPFTKRGTMDERGSGLGLLFVKEYTERCGGTFSITSEKGKGSRFCITLNKAL